MVIVTSVSLVTMETLVNINAEVAVSRMEHVTKQMGNVIVLLDGQETNVINVWGNVHHVTEQVAVAVVLVTMEPHVRISVPVTVQMGVQLMMVNATVARTTSMVIFVILTVLATVYVHRIGAVLNARTINFTV